MVLLFVISFGLFILLFIPVGVHWGLVLINADYNDKIIEWERFFWRTWFMKNLKMALLWSVIQMIVFIVMCYSINSLSQ
ncbi:hypothetical protein [Brevibacillus fortis]|uniref:hypothetical protein n=1 Tax=Brevibacillus fortis TaxID=2126352 RepID=UPI0038FC3C83